MRKFFTTLFCALFASLSLSAATTPLKKFAEATAKASADVEITDYKTVEFTVAETDLVDQIAEAGRFQIYGIKEDGFEAYVAFYGTQIPGEYTTSDAYYEACGIITSPYDYTGVLPVSVDATVVATENGYKCTSTFVGQDGTQYNLVFNYEFPTPAPTTITVDGEVEDNTASKGYFQISALDKEYKRTFEFRVNASAFAAGEYGADAIDGEHTYFVLYSKYAEVMDLLEYVSGTGTLSCQDGRFTWTGTYLMKSTVNEKTTEYTITINGGMPLKEGNAYDYNEDGFAATSPWSSAEIDTKHAADGVIALDTWTPTSDGLDLQVHLEFNVAAQDAEHVLPLGTYPINSTRQPGTVTAASMTKDMNGSFVAYTIYGMIISPLWFIDEGSVVVEEGVDGLCITVDAINTWGLPLNIQIGEAKPNGINAISTPAARSVKTIARDGIRINKDGKLFNIKGIQVKE